MAQKSAYLLGAERVIAIDRFPERLRAAREQVRAPKRSITKKWTASSKCYRT